MSIYLCLQCSIVSGNHRKNIDCLTCLFQHLEKIIGKLTCDIFECYYRCVRILLNNNNNNNNNNPIHCFE
ncbi:unnamed protein product [Schistosoma mattheei]|uniref:Uncharacterized protein n=1 Tax=Schistosoma mattheei TaxID=31246 RepID=A0A183PLB8_9TREM|nr:unnamed protein product [Schistosoma mattheei]